MTIRKNESKLASMLLIGIFSALCCTTAASQNQPQRRIECEAVEGSLLIDAWTGVVFVGEHHGTQEIPRQFGNLVCSQLQHRQRIHVALEWPASWTNALRSYVRAPNKTMAQAILLEETDWLERQKKFPDGLTSEAMVSLLDSLRQWSRSGAEIELSSFDTRQWESPTHESDVGMAASLTRHIEEASADLTLVLTGEYHARLSPGTGRVTHPMAQLVAQARPQWSVHSIQALAGAGDMWGCSAKGCGVLPYRTNTPEMPERLQSTNGTDPLGYSAWLRVGPATASPPWPEKQP